MRTAHTKLNDLEKQMSQLRREQGRLEAANFKDELRPAIEASIGKTFVYRRNCYSCPEKPSDYWDSFQRLVGVEFSEYHAWLIFQRVQVDARGKPEITLHTDLISSRDEFPKTESGWVPCEAEEFESAYAFAVQQFNTHDLFAKAIAAGG